MFILNEVCIYLDYTNHTHCLWTFKCYRCISNSNLVTPNRSIYSFAPMKVWAPNTIANAFGKAPHSVAWLGTWLSEGSNQFGWLLNCQSVILILRRMLTFDYIFHPCCDPVNSQSGLVELIALICRNQPPNGTLLRVELLIMKIQISLCCWIHIKKKHSGWENKCKLQKTNDDPKYIVFQIVLSIYELSSNDVIYTQSNTQQNKGSILYRPIAKTYDH